MATNVFEHELEKLTARFNRVFGEEAVGDLRARSATILVLCRAGMLAHAIRSPMDERETKTVTGEFMHLRNVLNRFFDAIELQQKRRSYDATGNTNRIAAGG